MHLGLVLVEDSNLLHPFCWGFLKEYLELCSGYVVVCFLVSRWEDAAQFLFSRCQMPFHTGIGGLAAKAITVAKQQP
jgi:hypothetical protein